MIATRSFGGAVLVLTASWLLAGASPVVRRVAQVDATPDDDSDCPVGKVLASVDHFEGKSDLAASLAKLRAAAKNRDLATLKGLITDDVAFALVDEGAGRDGFLRYWHFGRRDDPAASKLWPELAKALSRGGGWVGAEYCFPFVYAAWPEECDYDDYALVLRDGAALHRGQTVHSPILERLHAEIVETPAGGDPAWTQVISNTGHQGYVQEADIAQATGYRGCLRQVKGTWQLATFVTGD